MGIILATWDGTTSGSMKVYFKWSICSSYTYTGINTWKYFSIG